MELGLTYTSTTVVDKNNTAFKLGSGNIEVFATPAMVALMENAAMLAVENVLEIGDTTVGAMMNTSHIRPSGLGESVEAIATLVDVEGRKLTFKIVASDKNGTIGEATHIRYIVNKEKFLSRL